MVDEIRRWYRVEWTPVSLIHVDLVSQHRALDLLLKLPLTGSHKLSGDTSTDIRIRDRHGTSRRLMAAGWLIVIKWYHLGNVGSTRLQLEMIDCNEVVSLEAVGSWSRQSKMMDCNEVLSRRFVGSRSRLSRGRSRAVDCKEPIAGAYDIWRRWSRESRPPASRSCETRRDVIKRHAAYTGCHMWVPRRRSSAHQRCVGVCLLARTNYAAVASSRRVKDHRFGVITASLAWRVQFTLAAVGDVRPVR